MGLGLGEGIEVLVWGWRIILDDAGFRCIAYLLVTLMMTKEVNKVYHTSSNYTSSNYNSNNNNGRIIR